MNVVMLREARGGFLVRGIGRLWLLLGRTVAAAAEAGPHRMAGMPDAQITRDDVAHLAGLARIALSDQELDRLAPELSKIVEAVATVSEALEEAGDVAPMSHPTPISNVFREDEVRPSLTPEEALAGAPADEDQRFLVPKILGEE